MKQQLTLIFMNIFILVNQSIRAVGLRPVGIRPVGLRWHGEIWVRPVGTKSSTDSCVFRGTLPSSVIICHPLFSCIALVAVI